VSNISKKLPQKGLNKEILVWEKREAIILAHVYQPDEI